MWGFVAWNSLHDLLQLRIFAGAGTPEAPPAAEGSTMQPTLVDTAAENVKKAAAAVGLSSLFPTIDTATSNLKKRDLGQPAPQPASQHPRGQVGAIDNPRFAAGPAAMLQPAGRQPQQGEVPGLLSLQFARNVCLLRMAG